MNAKKVQKEYAKTWLKKDKEIQQYLRSRSELFSSIQTEINSPWQTGFIFDKDASVVDIKLLKEFCKKAIVIGVTSDIYGKFNSDCISGLINIIDVSVKYVDDKNKEVGFFPNYPTQYIYLPKFVLYKIFK